MAFFPVVALREFAQRRWQVHDLDNPPRICDSRQLGEPRRRSGGVLQPLPVPASAYDRQRPLSLLCPACPIAGHSPAGVCGG